MTRLTRLNPSDQTGQTTAENPSGLTPLIGGTDRDGRPSRQDRRTKRSLLEDVERLRAALAARDADYARLADFVDRLAPREYSAPQRRTRNVNMRKNQPLAKIQPLIKSQQDDARLRIQVGRIIERVSKIASGEVAGDPAMLSVQLRANELLLRKALPDLSSVEMTGAQGGPLTITINKVT